MNDVMANAIIEARPGWASVCMLVAHHNLAGLVTSWNWSYSSLHLVNPQPILVFTLLYPDLWVSATTSHCILLYQQWWSYCQQFSLYLAILLYLHWPSVIHRATGKQPESICQNMVTIQITKALTSSRFHHPMTINNMFIKTETKYLFCV